MIWRARLVPSAPLSRVTLTLLLSLLAGACTDLPAIASGECGNAVIEGNETCDTFAPNPGGVCRPKGSVGECRLDCRKQSNGVQGVCPDGHACDSDGLCRAPTGRFEDDVTLGLAGVESLSAGDFDHDGRADLVSREPTDALLRARPTFHYFDESGALDQSRAFPKRIEQPYIGDITGDGYADLVFSTLLVGVLRGRSDRSWVPDTFSSYRIPNAHMRILGVMDRDLVSDDTSIVALTELAGQNGIFVPNEQGQLSLCATLPEPVEALAGEAFTANVIDGESSPCRELVFAYQGADAFWLVDPCDIDADSGLPIWNRAMQPQRIEFDPPARVEQGPLTVDLNHDGHLDVLIGASGRVYAAYGDGQKLAPAVPYTLRLHIPGLPEELPMPLAAGEFSGDGQPDFVLPSCLLVSQTLPHGGVVYLAAQGNNGSPWSGALVGDLNGNGLSDVLAASSAGPNVTFFNGTGSIFPVAMSVPVVGPVDHLASGDFDGDLVNDVAFIQHATSSSDEDSLLIAYGTVNGPPTAPITVAHVNAAEQVASFADLGMHGLTVASSAERNGTQTGELTLLEGSSDRLPLALHTLVSLADDGSVASSAAIGITVGDFTGEGHSDLVALGFKDFSTPYEYWLIPSISDNSSAPQKLESDPDPDFGVLAELSNGETRLALAGASGDLDGDGLDEAIWLFPSVDGERCALSWFNVEHGARRVVPRGRLVLDRPCLRPALLPVDADADGRLDIAVLTQNGTDDDARLAVLWNDGTGGFDVGNLTPASMPWQAPRAFTLLGRKASSTDIVFVTDTSLERVAFSNRTAGAPERLLELEHGTGVVAADFNGDQVLDLALADAGKVRLLLAQLVPP
ncbi:MAG: VCBS repeat-containing protein [Polyangiaceae bacterium]